LPKKMGMSPSSYGKLETQSNPDLTGKPTWEGKVRKFEAELKGWLGFRQDLKKSEDPNTKQSSDPGQVLVDFSQEKNEHHPELPGLFERAIAKPCGKKLIYSAIDAGSKVHRFLVQDYYRFPGKKTPTVCGWAAMTAQALAGAAGFGRFVERMCVVEEDGKVWLVSEIPDDVVHTLIGVPAPQVELDLQRFQALEYLMGSSSPAKIMYRDQIHEPFFFDFRHYFQYRDEQMAPPVDQKWWQGIKGAIKLAFVKRLALVKDPGVRTELGRHFAARELELDHAQA